ncbi:hypothetical protein DRQ50_03465 [bacterium]|nr:MAG: hypothetical protein DRQ50_03465 [bacterium]
MKPALPFRLAAACLLLLLILPTLGVTQTRIKVLSWNLEDRENDPATVADQLRQLEGFDILGLSEVADANISIYRSAAMEGEGARGHAPRFEFILGTTGNSVQRLAIIYDAKRFKELERMELEHMNDGNHRAPLAVRLQLKGTTETFVFMVNHLARGNAELRQQQARQLRVWASRQGEPVIAVGDYNFDFEIDTGRGNTAFHIMLDEQDGESVFKWIRPAELFASGMSGRYYAVLDFVLVANLPVHWSAASRILIHGFGPGDSPQTSDHRPVQGRFFIHQAPPADPSD